MPHDIGCWKCGAPLAALSLPFGRTERCPACGADLHACRLCGLYDPRAYQQCREPTVEEVREINRRVRADLWGDIEAGRLRLPIDRVFPLEQAAAALAHMRANAHFGKIVVEF